MMPSSGRGGTDPLSLLVNAAAADSRDARTQEPNPNAGAPFIGESLRRSLAGDNSGGLSLEEQILLHQQLQGPFGGSGMSMGFFSQLQQRDQGFLSQLGQQQQQQQQQQQLASLLGLGGGGAMNDVHAALAAAQFRQQQQQHQHQLTQADLMALSRSGALSGLSGLLPGGQFGPGGLGAGLLSGMHGPAGLGSELDGIQRLEELERRQRLFSASSGGLALGAPGVQIGSPPSGVRSLDSSERAAPSPPRIAQMETTESRAAARPDPPVPSKPKAAKPPPVMSAPAPEPVHPPAGVASAASAAAEDNKEELEKAPGSVIVPCRARGMPMDHNFKTAYFVIPENVKHGEELICSYFACRNAGIKFRYCSHCKVPVAKRNFRKRHKHGGEAIAMIPGEDSDGDDEVVVAAKKGIPSQITANHKEAVEADGISSQSTDSNPEKTEAELQKGMIRASVHTFEASKNRAAAVAVHAMHATVVPPKFSAERQQRWMDLLEKRPSTQDGDSMSTWLMQVLAVSDLETPLKPVVEMALISDETRAKAAQIIVKSPKALARARSTGSEDYGSSNSDSNDRKMESKMPAAAGIVKKKRTAEKEEEDAGAQASELFVSGSFAAWKERKKQKKQTKVTGKSEQV